MGGQNRLTQAEFIERAVRTHGSKYDYSRVVYMRQDIKVELVCSAHGPFWVAPSNHVRKMARQGWNPCGCPECGVESVRNRNKARKRTQTEAIQILRNIHGDRYEYGEYRGYSYPIEITCDEHGLFIQQFSNHSRGTGCPKCKNSKGEARIEAILINLSLNFEKQKSFVDCSGDTKPLLFDFYIPDRRLVIEYDGEQHFKPVKFHRAMSQETAERMFEKTQRYDTIKDMYCRDQGLKLLRIPYTHLKYAEQLIKPFY